MDPPTVDHGQGVPAAVTVPALRGPDSACKFVKLLNPLSILGGDRKALPPHFRREPAIAFRPVGRYEKIAARGEARQYVGHLRPDTILGGCFVTCSASLTGTSHVASRL